MKNFFFKMKVWWFGWTNTEHEIWRVRYTTGNITKLLTYSEAEQRVYSFSGTAYIDWDEVERIIEAM